MVAPFDSIRELVAHDSPIHQGVEPAQGSPMALSGSPLPRRSTPCLVGSGRRPLAAAATDGRQDEPNHRKYESDLQCQKTGGVAPRPRAAPYVLRGRHSEQRPYNSCRCLSRENPCLRAILSWRASTSSSTNSTMRPQDSQIR